ncbi:MAG: hypothetical protein LBQ50_02700 [Planctomycetaceae bacterium]|jgi:uncharacterized membrane protein|nr:hypothetical protein [Planctomycetaceae bacterium]
MKIIYGDFDSSNDFESRLQTVELENARLRAELAALKEREAEHCQKEAEYCQEIARLQLRVQELEATLRLHADGARSKPPKVTLNYSSLRNDVGHISS